MASVCDDPNGRRRIAFVAPDGSRKAIRLGKCDRRTADSICRHVEALLAAKTTGQPLSRETATWVGNVGDKLRDKLAAADLMEAIDRETLGAFLDRFIQNRIASSASNTVRNLAQAKRHLVDHFGDQCDLRAITAARAEEWAAKLLDRYSQATVGRTVKRARQFFKTALRDKLITENPFVEVNWRPGTPFTSCASGSEIPRRSRPSTTSLSGMRTSRGLRKAAQNPAHMRLKIERSK